MDNKLNIKLFQELNSFFIIIFSLILIISFSNICMAYSIDDYILDILMLYQKNLSNVDKEAIISRISFFSKTILSDNTKLMELSQKIASFPANQQILIYRILKNYFSKSVILNLFPKIKELKEYDINSPIIDKTKSISIIDENFDLNKQKINETQNNNESTKKDTEENKKESSSNQDKSQDKEQPKSSTDKKEENKSDTKNTDKKNSEETKAKLEFNLNGLKIPQVQEIYGKYSESELEFFYKDAVKLYYSGEFDKSLIEFWICLVNKYNNDSSSYYLALIYEKKQDFDSAIILYKNSIDLFLAKSTIDSKFISYLYKRLGISYINKKLYEEAILYLKKAIEYYPLDSESYFQIGLSYYNLQNYEKAKEYFQKAYQLGYQKAYEYLQKLN